VRWINAVCFYKNLASAISCSFRLVISSFVVARLPRVLAGIAFLIKPSVDILRQLYWFVAVLGRARQLPCHHSVLVNQPAWRKRDARVALTNNARAIKNGGYGRSFGDVNSFVHLRMPESTGQNAVWAKIVHTSATRNWLRISTCFRSGPPHNAEGPTVHRPVITYACRIIWRPLKLGGELASVEASARVTRCDDQTTWIWQLWHELRREANP